MNKTTFPLGVLVLTIALLTALSLTACDPAPDNNGSGIEDANTPQQNRTGTAALDRGLGTITVQVMGMTTQAEWNDIAQKIKDSIESGLEANITSWGEQVALDAYKELFDRGVTYIMEPKPVEYTICKTTGDGKTAYVALDKIDVPTVWTDVFFPLYQKKSVIYGLPYTPLYTNPATITQGTPNGLAFAGSVTIKSDDTYTPAAWDAVVAKVVAAFNAAYESASGPAKNRFASVFGNDAGAKIVLVNNLTNNWEVRDGDFKTLYLKTGSITTADYATAVQRMNNSIPEVGKAAPQKHRVFLAQGQAKVPVTEFV